jgi:hypothetical protein
MGKFRPTRSKFALLALIAVCFTFGACKHERLPISHDFALKFLGSIDPSSDVQELEVWHFRDVEETHVEGLKGLRNRASLNSPRDRRAGPNRGKRILAWNTQRATPHLGSAKERICGAAVET